MPVQGVRYNAQIQGRIKLALTPAMGSRHSLGVSAKQGGKS